MVRSYREEIWIYSNVVGMLNCRGVGTMIIFSLQKILWQWHEKCSEISKETGRPHEEALGVVWVGHSGGLDQEAGDVGRGHMCGESQVHGWGI